MGGVRTTTNGAAQRRKSYEWTKHLIGQVMGLIHGSKSKRWGTELMLLYKRTRPVHNKNKEILNWLHSLCLSFVWGSFVYFFFLSPYEWEKSFFNQIKQSYYSDCLPLSWHITLFIFM